MLRLIELLRVVQGSRLGYLLVGGDIARPYAQLLAHCAIGPACAGDDDGAILLYEPAIAIILAWLGHGTSTSATDVTLAQPP